MKNLVTICTVSYTHKSLLEINWDFVKRLNPNAQYSWIVVENSPPDSSERLALDDARFKVLPGLEREDRPFAACYHAAGAFMKALSQARTRFVLLLDPDFFVVQRDWLNKMVSHMQARELAFLGAPIYPTLYHKWRYFPCTQLMMIDREKTGFGLDLTPCYKVKPVSNKNSKRQVVPQILPTSLARLKTVLRLILKRGAVIDSSRDTAWKLYQDYKNRPWLYECVQPVMKLADKPLRPTWLNSTGNQLLEKFLPDRWCYIPKRKNYFTEFGFKERGYFDAAGEGWDETIFQDRPFSFHLRGALASGLIRDHSEELPILRRALATFS